MPAPLDLTAVRRDFPILSREVNGKPLAYLDNAATTQKPASVIDAVSDFYREENANVHRGVHYLSMVATDLYDHARARVAKAIRAGDGGQARRFDGDPLLHELPRLHEVGVFFKVEHDRRKTEDGLRSDCLQSRRAVEGAFKRNGDQAFDFFG